MKAYILFISFFSSYLCVAQHSNELVNDGGSITVQPGAAIYVMGDVHMQGATGLLNNNGTIEVQGNSYSDSQFQQRGTGVYRIDNSDVNIGERQFISGSYSVRGGQGQIGVNDGSFYDLQLANDQGIVFLVGGGNIADVRNSVDFGAGSVTNRIITHDIGITGAYTPPTNGSGYSGVFGLMNSTSGIGNFLNNTVSSNGNLSGVDNGYIQGKLRRAINPVGGTYNYVLGLEPAGGGAQRGFQYIHIDVDANNYNVITGYFESASSNSSALTVECSGESLNYWGGTDHGEWMFSDISGSGTGTYEIRIWPQDHNYPGHTIWAITKDNTLSGTPNDCGLTTIGLSRTGFDGFGSPSEFNVAAPTSPLPVELYEVNALGIIDHINLSWSVASENNFSHYEIERSENALDFTYMKSIVAQAGPGISHTYSDDDFDTRPNQFYYYRIKSVDLNGAFEYSPTVSARINGTGLAFNEDAVWIYPNPSSNDFVLNIHSDNTQNVSIQILNTLGQAVDGDVISLNKGSTSLTINASSWAKGVYIVELQNILNGEVIIKRFVKN